MGDIVEGLVPARLGTGFRWLLASSWTSNLGDGIALAAGPLLVASLTGDAFWVALAATVQWLPPLLFGLFAGALTDRLDRRLIVATVDVARAAVLAVLTLAVATDAVSIVAVLAALFVLGTAEVFADNSSQTLLPMLVAREDLAVANSRLQTGFITVNQLAGPPLGAALFTVGAAWALGRRWWWCCSGRCWSPGSRCLRGSPPRGLGPSCGTTSPRACAGCSATPPSARWC